RTELIYPIKIERDETGWLITFPDFPEANSFAYSTDEIYDWAQGCLDTVLIEYIKQGQELPTPSKGGNMRVAPSVLLSTKIMLNREVTRQGLRMVDLVKRLGMNKTLVSRL